MRHLLGFLFIQLLISIGFAQESRVIRMRSVGKNEGLSNSKVNDICQDKLGFIWFATNAGLNRFDGYKCIVFEAEPGNKYSLSENRISTLCAAQDGGLYVGTFSGALHKYDPLSNRFYRLDSTAALQKLFKAKVLAINETSSGDLFVGLECRRIIYLPHENAGAKLVYDAGANYKPEYESICFTRGANDRTWACIDHVGFFALKADGSGFDSTVFHLDTKWATEEKARNPKPTQPMTWMGSTTGNDTLVVKFGMSLFFFDTRLQKIHPIQLDSTQMEVPLLDRKGYIWHRWLNKLYRYDTHTGINETVFDLSGTYQNILMPRLQDRSGIIWGTNDYEVLYFDAESPFGLYSSKMSAPDYIHPVSTREIKENKYKPGKLLITGYHALDQLTPGNGLEDPWGQPTDKPWTNQHGYSFIQMGRDTLLMGGDFGGMYYINLRTGKITQALDDVMDHHSAFPGEFFNFCIKEYRNQIWMAGSYGVFTFDPRKGKATYRISHIQESEWNALVWTLLPDGDTIWAGTERGLLWLDLKSGKSAEHPLIKDMKVRVKCLHRSGKYLWIGTDGSGLMRVDIHNTDMKRDTLPDLWLKKQDGLPDNTVYGILEDDHGLLWLSTNNGLVRYNPSNGEILSFNQGYNLQGLEFNTASYYKDKKGTLYFGGLNGITFFNPNQVRTEEVPAQLVFTDMEIFGKASDLPISINQDAKLEMGPEQSIFSLEFALLDYFNPGNHHFAYRLENLHEEWIDLGTAHKIIFTGLSPGKYKLIIRSTDRFGRWRTVGRSIQLVILPPWYATWYFRVSMGALLLFATFIFIRIRTSATRSRTRKLEDEVARRTKDLEEKNQQIAASLLEREALLKEVHHRVKNNLEVVSSLLSLQAANHNDPQLEGLLAESRSRVQSMAMIHRKLYSSEGFSQINMKDYLHDLSDSILHTFGAPGKNVEVDILCEGIQMDIDTAIPLGLIVNELLTNTMKYAFKGMSDGARISLELTKEEQNGFRLSFSDNGAGLPADFDLRHQKSLGLSLVKDLTRQLKGKLSILSFKPAHFLIIFMGSSARKQID